MYKFFRSILFRLDPERAHRLTLFLLRHFHFMFRRKLPKKTVFLWGLEFPNPLGIAAGFDKNAECVDGLFSLGFGFVEVGTVTPKPQPGNPKPRLFRIPSAWALINRMGFNNLGLEKLIANIKARKSTGILAVNIGKNASTPLEVAFEDYLFCLEKVYSYADIIVVNISSPNTKGLRDLQQAGQVEELLLKCREKRDALARENGKRVPLLLKITIDLEEHARAYIAECLLKVGFDGIIISNTTIDHSPVKGLPFAEEVGGLSGKPLFPQVLEAITQLRALLPKEIGIIGVGGVFSASDAKALLAAGANLVQIYSGMVYRGPGLVTEIIQAL
jgi:dihydroorotate dehydrogenase